MAEIALVAVAKAVYAIDRPYSYRIPPELRPRLRPGMRVLVPFGAGNRGSDGLVLSLAPENPEGPPLKDIQCLLDEEPVLSESLVQVALWMRERCWCTLYECVRAMLPAGLSFALRDRLCLVNPADKEGNYAAVGEGKTGARLLDMLYDNGGGAEMGAIRRAFGTTNPSGAIRRLQDAGKVRLESTARRFVTDRTEKVAELAMDAEDAMALVAPKRKTAPMRFAVTELLCSMGQASVKELCYFTGASAQTIKSLERDGILALQVQEAFRRPQAEAVEPAEPPVLNREQETAFQGLAELSRRGKACAALLYGVTGSGKTQVYIRLIQDVLERGKTAMVLVPEIALTPQMLRVFASHFGDRIALLHSSLRTGERYDEWKRCRSGDAKVVIGTRSAVFAPLENLGLIVLDEEQEGSYKSENAPRYHARDIARYRCFRSQALLLLGSATPSVETMYKAIQGTYKLFTLKQRYNRQPLPRVVIADMREELRRGNPSSLGRELREELDRNLVSEEQSILFLNRRGASRMLLCGECGYVPECPHCTMRLTFHSANRRLMCHACGYSQSVPRRCPRCGGAFHQVGAGTQQVEEELNALYPLRTVIRMDTDTVSATHPHEQLLEKFREAPGSVLVGTQMVAKGLDFEAVTLVGAVAPDLALYADSFRAAERTFSLLTQVVGRAGRGNRLGRAVIQTCCPDDDVIRCAARQDYDSFYRGEINLRRLRGLPPFADLVVLTASGLDEPSVIRCCQRMKTSLAENLGAAWRILGPAPAPIARVADRWRWRLTLSGACDHAARTYLESLLKAVSRDKESRGVTVVADLNPYDS